MKKSFIPDVVAALFILLFMYAAASKLIEFEKFKVQLAQSPLLTSFTDIIAVVIPVIEIIISFALLAERYRIYGLYSAFTIMVMFTVYIVAITNFSAYIPCSCGGVLSGLNWNQHLVFNILFAGLAATAILLYAKPAKATKSALAETA